MFRIGLICGLLLIACSCTTQPNSRRLASTNTSKVAFLTRGGCVNTATMRSNVDEALRSLEMTLNYDVLDLDSLRETDARRGYPTPTLLYDNRDLFDLSEPRPPFPEPT